MAFIVKKNIHGKDYYYLRESKREDGKVKAVTVAYLGKTKKEAEKKLREREGKIKTNKEKKKQDKNIPKELTIEDLAAFCKRKGFVYSSGEIYGGLAGFWDFGYLGVELKNNIKKQWWKFFVQSREDVVGIDGSIVTHPKVWEASGHVGSFSDLSVFCKKCKKPNKVDKEELENAKCAFCGGELDKKTGQDLNLMFETKVGPIEEQGIKSYLRPETAQLIFTNFKQESENSRMKLPFGIAQIGKAFRNEIAPRDFIFRSREFEQMEVEYFILPDEKCDLDFKDLKVLFLSADMQKQKKSPIEMSIKEALKKKIIKRDWHAYWLAQCLLWFKSLDCNMKNFRLRQHSKDELAHYSSDCWDLEYKFPFGWKELTGIADRSNYDLSQHEKFSRKDLKLFVDGKGKILPHVVAEPSFGVERAFLVFMLEAYKYDSQRENIVLQLSAKLSPVKAAVFPIIKKPEYERISEDIVQDLGTEFHVVYDRSGSIGRRYSRNDEQGTPYCITIDDQSPKKKDVTIRNRNDTKQIRVKISDLRDVMRKLINQEIEFDKAGKLVETRVK